MTNHRDAIELQVFYAGESRRVWVRLGEPCDIQPTGERRRLLELATERSRSRGLVEPSISWAAVLAQVEILLALEGESEEVAHIRRATASQSQLGRSAS